MLPGMADSELRKSKNSASDKKEKGSLN